MEVSRKQNFLTLGSRLKRGAKDQGKATPNERRLYLFLELIVIKAYLNLKSESKKSYLSYLWWVIEPALYMLVFYLVFGVLLERGGPGFIAYLLTGLVPFQWFSKTVVASSNSIVGGRGLMHKINISPIFFPLVTVAQSAFKQSVVFFILFLFLSLYGLPPTISWLALPVIIFVQFVLILWVSCAVSLIVPFARDVTYLVSTGIQFLLFASGVFYNISRIPDEWKWLFFINPMANLLYQYRTVLISGLWPDWISLASIFSFCLVVSVLLCFVYQKVKKVYPRVVTQ